MLEVSEEVYSSLRRQFKGDLLRPGGNGYDDARTIWNGMCARTPGLIARCLDVSDIQSAIRSARAIGIQRRSVVEGIASRGSAPAIMAW